MNVMDQETMKSNIYVQTADGYIQEVEPKVAELCGTLYKEMQSGLGCCKNNPIYIPPTIRPTLLRFVFEYCRYRHVSGRPYMECISFDQNLLKMDANFLCELIQVADYLQMKSLIDCICEAMYKKIQSVSSSEACSEELYRMLNCADNLTEKEQASRIKLLTRLLKEKNKEAKENENITKSAVVPKTREHEDTRSIDDLLAFIEGGDGDSKGARSSKKKRKKSKKREGQKNTPSPCAASSSNKASNLKKVVKLHDEISTQDTNTSIATSHGVQSIPSISTMFTDKLKLSDDKSFSSGDDFDIFDDLDDADCDPPLSEELDREVKDFARRLRTKPPVIYFDSSSQYVDRLGQSFHQRSS